MVWVRGHVSKYLLKCELKRVRKQGDLRLLSLGSTLFRVANDAYDENSVLGIKNLVKRTITLVDNADPPKFATSGAERWITMNPPRNAVGM